MTDTQLKTSKLDELTSEYLRKGYRVVARPRPEEVPQFLREFQLDLVAVSDNDKVAVVVKSSPDLTSQSLVHLAEAVEAQQGWRLELVVVNQPAAPEIPIQGELVPEDRVESLLHEAHVLNGEKRSEAAAMMAWAAAESVLRRLVGSVDVRAERKSSGTILKQLYVLGLIDAEEYDSFNSAMEFRNAFAHGFAATVSSETIERFIRDVEQLRSRAAA